MRPTLTEAAGKVSDATGATPQGHTQLPREKLPRLFEQQKGVYRGVLVTIPDHQGLSQISRNDLLVLLTRATRKGYQPCQSLLSKPRELTGLAELISQQGLHRWPLGASNGKESCLQREEMRVRSLSQADP